MKAKLAVEPQGRPACSDAEAQEPDDRIGPLAAGCKPPTFRSRSQHPTPLPVPSVGGVGLYTIHYVNPK